MWQNVLKNYIRNFKYFFCQIFYQVALVYLLNLIIQINFPQIIRLHYLWYYLLYWICGDA